MTSTATTRHNPALGTDCPPWCIANHGAGIGACIGRTGSIDFGDRGLDSMWAGPVLAAHHDGRPAVSVTACYFERRDAPYNEVSAVHAGQLAGLVEMLAGATPDQHRELAAAIRGAAAALTGPRDCSRCDGCGQLADTDDREPWTAWTSLPAKSAMAVLMGFVTPVSCDVCGGTGKVAGA